MKILHLFSNTKMTGPAEPAINLCASLKGHGYDVMFACCTAKANSKSVEVTAATRGLNPITRFKLNKHLNLRDNMYDLRRLPRFLEECRANIVHAHLDNDHLIGGRSSRKASRDILVVRSSYSGEGIKPTLRNQYLMGRLTDGLIVASESARASAIEDFGFPEDRIWVIPGAIDTSRFDSSKVTEDFRPRFGLKRDDFVVGVVARIQPHRRFDALLEAMKKVSKTDPSAKLVIIGRGTRMRQVAIEPVERMRLGGCVSFPGYQVGDDYVNTLGCFDVLIYLMPGTDGTCRTVREAMAMGKPVIAARRGMLSEIVDHAVNGLVVEDSPDTLAGAISYLARNPEIVASMSKQAARKAHQKFRLDTQARSVGWVYERLSNMGRLK
jgi:glycosyltransferase involved in cell wall biosynthesis